MTHFKRYEFQELAGGPPLQAEEIEPHKEKQFDSFTQKDAAIASLRNSTHFRLDPTVAGQLGLDEREKKETELKVQKEIERRWEKLSEKAEVAGYTKGLEEGKKEAYGAELPRIKEKVEKLDRLINEMSSFREKIFLANETFLMDLIAQVAGMVALKEVQLDRDYIKRLVISLLHQVGTKDDLKIYLSKADQENADQLFQSIEKEFGKCTNTTIESREDIPVGGCKIETRFGVVDASVFKQIENVMNSLKA